MVYLQNTNLSFVGQFFGWYKEELQYLRQQKILASTCKANQFISLQQAVHNYLIFALSHVPAIINIWD